MILSKKPTVFSFKLNNPGKPTWSTFCPYIPTLLPFSLTHPHSSHHLRCEISIPHHLHSPFLLLYSCILNTHIHIASNYINSAILSKNCVFIHSWYVHTVFFSSLFPFFWFFPIKSCMPVYPYLCFVLKKEISSWNSCI